MTLCDQVDCSGSVEDGFCDLCGMAPISGASAAPVETAGTASGARLPGSAPPEEGSVSPTTPAAMAAPSSGGSGSGSGGASSGSRGSRGSSGRTATRGTMGGGGTGSTAQARRGMLGAGLVEVPPVPYRDPADAVMERPEVPENRRFCSRCEAPVGRGREGRRGRTEGFCKSCGHPFSFNPKLNPGDWLGGQYEVLGCLAHGGLGWVYLARDHNVSGRWVVLKGLLDTGDSDSLAAATAERAFLAEVEHPNIVKIYNFVRHGGSGYIVMEYVGGRSLKDILLRRRREEGEHAALPLGQVIAYGLEVLRAFGYLHGVGLLYCDFKPDNAIQSEEQLKLIDLGGVRRAFDVNSPIFGTPGYQAPEIADQGPSVSSDLYTVGRALAVLSFPFRGYTGRHLRSLPPRDEVPLLVRYESYYRLLRRATHMDPALRFQSAEEMAEQLTGVLREVLSADDARPRPAPSALFGPEQHAAGTEIVSGPAAGVVLPRANGAHRTAGARGAARPALTGTAADGMLPVLAPLSPVAAAVALPVPLVAGSDPAAGFLAGLTARDPEELAAALAAAPMPSTEVSLALARVRIELGELDAAGRVLDDIAAGQPDDWRADWYRGAAALAAGRFRDASEIFDDLYDLMPGETAPKLALAFCYECEGGTSKAARYYETVWRTDPTFVSAAFGLARVRLEVRDRKGAEEVLDSVPRISSNYLAAQLAAVVTAVRGRRPSELDAAALVGAGRRLEGLRLDTERYNAYAAEVLEAGLAWLRAQAWATPGPMPSPVLTPAAKRRAAEGGDAGGEAAEGRPTELLGTPLTEPALRLRLERTYRLLAKLADGAGDRHALVKRANAVRPRTLF
ncbi:serine/threonine-protein kinase [Actinomadura rugatobispora]|uniref:non-specific serine/threonine protein kinase n=1 Tax=Actinomadura rugatobispora TaxID=1994 RepID=A0ABW0ZYK2_9ACTN|nr:serine/threonine-protein kinase [Actinomadura rugatobispora]